MDKQKIKLKILNDLDFGMTPTYNTCGIKKEEFIILLNEMEQENLLYYTIIEEHPLFKGEPKNIYITDKGKIYLEDKKRV